MTQAPQPPANPQPAPSQFPAPQPTGQPRDYTMAWLPHLLLILTSFIGPLIIWLMKKGNTATDADRLAVYHGKQAAFMGFAEAAVYIVGGIVPIVGWFCILPVGLLGIKIYAIIGLVQSAQGKPFKYYFIADKFCAKEFAAAYPGAVAGQQIP